MRVAIYTDASIVNGKGAWATVIIREGCDPIEHSGPLRGRFRSSAATEVAAIANALFHARRSGAIERGDVVEVWCDNMAAIAWANGTAAKLQTNKGDPVMVEARRFIRDTQKRYWFTVTAAHVKGHQRLDSPDPRAIYNIRCDHLCSAVRDNREALPFSALVADVAARQARRLKRKALAA